MNMKRLTLSLIALGAVATPLGAQLALPDMGQGAAGRTLGGIGGTLGDTVGDLGGQTVGQTVGSVTRTVRGLAQARLDRLDRLARANRKLIEKDAAGDLARRGELLLMDGGADAIATAQRAGFVVLSRERLDDLGVEVVRLAVPSGMGLARAQGVLAQALPGATISADTLHFPGGTASGRAGDAAGGVTRAMPPIATPVGVIDGGATPALKPAEMRGFARGAPKASDHGSAVTSLLQFAGVQRVLVADIYGSDPAGGNALAVAQALDWLVGKGVKVVSVSLVGPANPLLARAVAAAQGRGAVIVAAVGNDGPAAPPSYPASYPGVIAVTAVDGRNRALIEAGRALHLDYAAPGADIAATNAAGRRVKVRGTSFATPLVASRVALKWGAGMGPKLDAEAIDLGARGPDGTYGRGLLCTICRPAR